MDESGGYPVEVDDPIARRVEAVATLVSNLPEKMSPKTERWINAFSQLPDSAQSVFKKSQYWAYIGEVDFQNDSTMTQKHFREVVMSNLRNIHSNSRQRELADYFTNSIKCAVTIIGIQPACLDFGKAPSKAVISAASEVAGAIKDIVRGK